MEHTTLEALAIEILDNECSNEYGPVHDKVHTGDYRVYQLEGHCITYTILAKKVNGIWFVKSVTLSES